MSLNRWKTVSTLAFVVSLLAPQLGAQNAAQYLACVDSTSAAEKVRIKQLTKSGKDVKVMTSEELGKICKRPSQVALVRTAQAAESTPPEPKVEAPKPKPTPTPAPTRVATTASIPKPAPAPTTVEVPAEPDPTPAQLAADNSAPKAHVPTRHPFTKFTVSRGSLILAIQKGDTNVLNVTPKEFVNAYNKTYPDLKLENPEDLVNHLLSLEVIQMPRGKPIRLSRIRNDGTVDLDGWVRDVHPTEQALMNPKTGRIELSLYCGNIVRSLMMMKGWVPPKAVSRVALVTEEPVESPVEVKVEVREESAPDPVVIARRRLAPPAETSEPAPVKKEPSWRPGPKTIITTLALAAVGGYIFSRLSSGPGACSAVGSAGACAR